MTKAEVEQMLADAEMARITLSNLCEDPSSFRMCIPVQFDDTDVRLAKPIHDLPALAKAYQSAMEALEKLRVFPSADKAKLLADGLIAAYHGKPAEPTP